MSTHNLWQVDAFTDTVFKGNPAAVMVLDDWLPDEAMLNIAQENNLAETAFIVPEGSGAYKLRWFTPGAEVPLCGHATLASAHILWTELGVQADQLTFNTLSGPLRVTMADHGYCLDFPADRPTPVSAPEGLIDALGVRPEGVMAGQYLMAVLETEEEVRNLEPDLLALNTVRSNRDHGVAEDCVIITAASGGELDFVSRFFGPTVGITEDPVTGSAHCMLTPYWAERLKKTKLRAFQASPRGGYLDCELKGDRVLMTGQAITYLRGRIVI